MKENCIHCSCSIIKKNGVENGKQQFKCFACGRNFLSANRIDALELRVDFVRFLVGSY
jgi:transposase-like protein